MSSLVMGTVTTEQLNRFNSSWSFDGDNRSVNSAWSYFPGVMREGSQWTRLLSERVTVSSGEPVEFLPVQINTSVPAHQAERELTGSSTARGLLKHLGAWVGNDLDECLEIVKSSRSQIEL